MEDRALRDGTREFCRRTLTDKAMRMIKGKIVMKHPPSLRTMKVGRRNFQKIYTCGNQPPQKGMNGSRQAFFLVSELRSFQKSLLPTFTFFSFLFRGLHVSLQIGSLSS